VPGQFGHGGRVGFCIVAQQEKVDVEVCPRRNHARTILFLPQPTRCRTQQARGRRCQCRSALRVAPRRRPVTPFRQRTLEKELQEASGRMRFPQKWFSAQDHLFGRHCHEAADSRRGAHLFSCPLCLWEAISRLPPSSARMRSGMLDQQLTRGVADRLNAHAVYADDEGAVDSSAATEALIPGAHWAASCGRPVPCRRRVPEWRERLICSACGSSEVDMVVTGTERR